MEKLIDADKMIEDLQNIKNTRPDMENNIGHIIDSVIKWLTVRQADYDVEAVVEELKEVAFPDVDENYTDDGQQMLFLYDAIEAVKKGGVKNE